MWGQVRYGEVHQVQVQRQRKGSSAWVALGTLTTDERGYWSLKVKIVKARDIGGRS